MDNTQQNNKCRLWEKMESQGNTSCNWGTWKGPKNLGKRVKELEISGRLETIQSTWNFLTAYNWSCLSPLPCQNIGSLSPTEKQQLQQPQQCWDY